MILAYLFIITSVYAAPTCPPGLAKAEFCPLWTRYDQARRTLAKRGIPDDRLADGLAPRLIELAHWKNVREAQGYSPWHVYQVAGSKGPDTKTWAAWEKAAAVIDKRAAANRKLGRWQAIDRRWVFMLHHTAMHGLLDDPARLRTNPVYGPSFERERALTPDEIRGVRAHRIRWIPTRCMEDAPAAAQEAFRKDARAWRHDDFPELVPEPKGGARQCGLIEYTPPAEISARIDEWIRTVNKASAGDPLEHTARAQQEFVVIHPFLRGNGRLSRFVLDLIWLSHDLPPPILADMNRDLYLDTAGWKQEIRAGLEEAVRIREACAAAPASDRGCSVVGQDVPVARVK